MEIFVVINTNISSTRAKISNFIRLNDVSPLETIGTVLSQIVSIEGIPPHPLNLYFGNTQLSTENTLASYNIRNNDYLTITYILSGNFTPDAGFFNQGLAYYFYNNYDTSYTPPLTDISGLYLTRSNVKNIADWNLVNITDASNAFRNINFQITDSDTSDIRFWDVSNITNMEGMFQDCSGFNQDISNWNVSDVSNMKNMFSGATSFNQYINDWSVNNVTTMEGMFAGATSFDQSLMY